MKTDIKKEIAKLIPKLNIHRNIGNITFKKKLKFKHY